MSNPNGVWALYKRPGNSSRLFNPTGLAMEPISRRGPTRPGPILFHRIRSPRCGRRRSATSARYSTAFTAASSTPARSTCTAEEFRTGTDFSSLVWTSPQAGTVHIDGGLWISKAFDRPHQWQLLKNGVVFTSGGLSQSDSYDKTNPFAFAGDQRARRRLT